MTEILAVRPPGTSTVIHLELPGYRPSHRTRGVVDTVLCNAFVKRDHTQVALADALAWTTPPAAHEPHEQWRWCRGCLGHAVAIHGLGDRILKLIVEAP